MAHRIPSRVLRSENVEFDAVHLMERCRLFLIIALGEAILTTATSTSAADGWHSAIQGNNDAPTPGNTPQGSARSHSVIRLAFGLGGALPPFCTGGGSLAIIR